MSEQKISVTSARPGVAAGTVEMTLSTGDTWRVDEAGAEEPAVVRRLHGGTFRAVGRLNVVTTDDAYVFIDPGAPVEDIRPATEAAPALLACWNAWAAVDEALLALSKALDAAGLGALGEEVLEDGVVALDMLLEELRKLPPAPAVRSALDACIAAARAAGYRVGS